MHEFELYGASLFETLRSKHGAFWRLERHWKRLCRSASTLGFDPPTFEAFSLALIEQADPLKDLILRYTLLQTGGGWSQAPRGQTSRILSRPYRPPLTQGIKLFIPVERVGCDDPFRNHKTGARFYYQHLLGKAKSLGFDDCLIIDKAERVLETCFSNVLWQTKDGWFTTHEDQGILPGIFREWLLEEGYVKEDKISLEALTRCQSILICNSVRGLKFVKSIGTTAIDIHGGQIFMKNLPKRQFKQR